MWPFTSRRYATVASAAHAVDLRAVRKMLDQGGDPNSYDPEYGAHAINLAVSRLFWETGSHRHDVEIIRLLVARGANVNTPVGKKTPLSAAEDAARKGPNPQIAAEVMAVLRRAGARLQVDDVDRHPTQPHAEPIATRGRRAVADTGAISTSSDAASGAGACFAKAAEHIAASCYDMAVAEFTRLIRLEPRSIRGYLGRADARAAEAAKIAENYRLSGGQQFQLTWEELNAPSSQPLYPPEKDRWWKLNERIMRLQHEATVDYEKVIQLAPGHSHALEMLKDLQEKSERPEFG